MLIVILIKLVCVVGIIWLINRLMQSYITEVTHNTDEKIRNLRQDLGKDITDLQENIVRLDISDNILDEKITRLESPTKNIPIFPEIETPPC